MPADPTNPSTPLNAAGGYSNAVGPTTGNPADRMYHRSLLRAGGQVSMLMAIRDMTPDELAPRVGLQTADLHDLMTGKNTNLPLATLQKIAAAIGGRIEVQLFAHEGN